MLEYDDDCCCEVVAEYDDDDCCCEVELEVEACERPCDVKNSPSEDPPPPELEFEVCERPCDAKNSPSEEPSPALLMPSIDPVLCAKSTVAIPGSDWSVEVLLACSLLLSLALSKLVALSSPTDEVPPLLEG